MTYNTKKKKNRRIEGEQKRKKKQVQPLIKCQLKMN